MPAKGVPFRYPIMRSRGRFKLPPLLWGGFALSYPIDATICRTGAVFAICDNGAVVHQVDSGAADRLAGVRNSDAGGAALSCPPCGQLHRARENLGISQHPPAALRRDGTDFASIARGYPRGSDGIGDTGKGSGISGFLRFSHRCDRLCILPIISAIWPVAQMVGNFPRSLRPLAGPVVGFAPWVYPLLPDAQNTAWAHLRR